MLRLRNGLLLLSKGATLQQVKLLLLLSLKFRALACELLLNLGLPVPFELKLRPEQLRLPLSQLLLLLDSGYLCLCGFDLLKKCGMPLFTLLKPCFSALQLKLD